MTTNRSPVAIDADHVRHEVSTVETIARGILANLESDPKLAKELTKSAVHKLDVLLEYMDSHSDQQEVV